MQAIEAYQSVDGSVHLSERSALDADENSIGEAIDALLSGAVAACGGPLQLNHYYANKLPVVLRVKDGIIETSHGARVPVSAITPELWAKINEARTQGLAKFYDLQTQLGHYKLDMINADSSIDVGCHHIEFKELARIAPQVFGGVQ